MPDNQTYNPAVGYADTSEYDITKMRNTLGIVKRIIDRHSQNLNPNLILVAGCGDGMEARILGEIYQSQVLGIDISLDHAETKPDTRTTLVKGSLDSLGLDDEQCDLIYSYHVLEHVSDHTKVLTEMARVLRTGRPLFIGFPNKNRLIGYMGTYSHATLFQKIQWNIQDYRHKLTGRFENHLGAHAGFTENEFMNDALPLFKSVIPVRNEYMLDKYSRYNHLITFLVKTRLSGILFPSNYYVCIK